ncbi:TetR/AcrR family transcriptional regulator [Mycobacterium sp. 2YAF39]|uniref:TetR/AcrR family transcriptional regulator n=1 Tax=Mycobacterium sp. 2YAF39 TaxID=3233033 RepID=UPI003F973E80
MPRMTRAQSQAQTRSELVSTARRLFFEDGYHPTSLEKVADAAGRSKGAVYSNFRNKDELCTAVLDEVRGERLAEILDIMATPDAASRIEALRDWAERVIGDPGWTSLEVEFAVHARRNDELRAGMADRLGGILQILTGAAESGGTAPDPQMPGGETATVMLALGIGLGLLRSIDPSIPITGLVDTLRLVGGQT